MDGEFRFEGEGISQLQTRWRGVLMDEFNNQWQFEWDPEGMVLELRDGTGRRAKVYTITDGRTLQVAATIFQGMRELSEPQQSLYGPPIVRGRLPFGR